VTKLPSSIRNVLLVAFIAVFAAGCDKNAAEPWHYWIALVMFGSALLVLLVVMPLNYYRKVWRLKHRGR
jgi:membrane protein YdbS with pleckstrin-like domain